MTTAFPLFRRDSTCTSYHVCAFTQVEGVALSFLFIVCVFGALGFSAMLLLIELTRARHKAELEDTARRALIDAVTGLPNKMAFQRDVDEALAIENVEVVFFSMDIQVPNQLTVLNRTMLYNDLD